MDGSPKKTAGRRPRDPVHDARGGARGEDAEEGRAAVVAAEGRQPRELALRPDVGREVDRRSRGVASERHGEAPRERGEAARRPEFAKGRAHGDAPRRLLHAALEQLLRRLDRRRVQRRERAGQRRLAHGRRAPGAQEALAVLVAAEAEGEDGGRRAEGHDHALVERQGPLGARRADDAVQRGPVAVGRLHAHLHRVQRVADDDHGGAAGAAGDQLAQRSPHT